MKIWAGFIGRGDLISSVWAHFVHYDYQLTLLALCLYLIQYVTFVDFSWYCSVVSYYVSMYKKIKIWLLHVSFFTYLASCFLYLDAHIWSNIQVDMFASIQKIFVEGTLKKGHVLTFLASPFHHCCYLLLLKSSGADLPWADDSPWLLFRAKVDSLRPWFMYMYITVNRAQNVKIAFFTGDFMASKVLVVSREKHCWIQPTFWIHLLKQWAIAQV